MKLLPLPRIINAVRSNFWVIPLVLASSAVLVAIFGVETELRLRATGYLSDEPAAMPLDAAQLVLSTIAGSMITVATLVFSMTLVALSLVSQQLGPRVLTQFMDDRPTQVVLGLFLATFLFALLVLTRIGQDADVRQVPRFSVYAGVGMAVLAMAAIIHFIHHVSKRIQADALIEELGGRLGESARDFVSNGDKNRRPLEDQEERRLKELFGTDKAMQIPAPESGYLDPLPEQTVVKLAARHGVVVRLDEVVGNYLLKGRAVVSVVRYDAGRIVVDEISGLISDSISVSPRRGMVRSIEFELDALVEIALRALSPGINDPYTANSCIDRLANGVRILMAREHARTVLRDADGIVRLVSTALLFERSLAVAFHPIRHAAQRNPLALIHLGKRLSELREISPTVSVQSAIDVHLKELQTIAESGQLAEADARQLLEVVSPR